MDKLMLLLLFSSLLTYGQDIYYITPNGNDSSFDNSHQANSKSKIYSFTSHKRDKSTQCEGYSVKLPKFRQKNFICPDIFIQWLKCVGLGLHPCHRPKKAVAVICKCFY